MPYLTIDEIKLRASKKNINLSIYTDDELSEIIDSAQMYIEQYTHKIFESRTLTETYLRFHGSLIQLKHYPVQTDVNHKILNGSLIIDGTNITGYVLNPMTGSIQLDVPRWNYGSWKANDITVTYTTCPFLDNPTKIHPTARSILSDMVLYTIKEGRSNQDIDYTLFNNRLDKITRPVMVII